jgi:phosphatidylglycerol---prolipoprotein diacylglyceryl transferase
VHIRIIVFMDFPVTFHFGVFTITAHTFFETVAFAAGFRYFLFLRKLKSDPIPEPNRVWIIIGAALGAFLFSRILGALEDPLALFSKPFSLVSLYAGKTIVGGLLGGLFTVEITKKLLGENKSSGDLFVYPLILAMVIGRIGCFSSGIYEPTFGNISTMPWAMDLGDDVLRHPVALYEILYLLALWTTLRMLEVRYIMNNGVLFKLFMIAYLVFRVIVEYFKPVQFVLPGLSSIQIACVAGLVYYFSIIKQLVLKPSRILVHE